MAPALGGAIIGATGIPGGVMPLPGELDPGLASTNATIELILSFGGGSFFIQAFSSMFVHFPLVPA